VVFELDHGLTLLEPIQMMHKVIFTDYRLSWNENAIMLT
jgi:hypothetical protein